jgi:hypothetical protein
MKKIIILLLIVLVMVSTAGFSQETKQDAAKDSSQQAVVTKTYVLKHVSPAVVDKALRQYFWESSYDRSSNMFTIKTPAKNLAEFERLLKQLDVEKKTILVRIFTVIASRHEKKSEIENKDLKRVLDRLQDVLSFKSFELDGVSALTVNDGQRRSQLSLASRADLVLKLEDIYIKGEKPGERTVGFEFQLMKSSGTLPEHGTVYKSLIASETSVKENGYLAAGVSRIGNGDSLVLVLNAEIK